MENHKINEGVALSQGDFMTRVMDGLPAGILLIRADRTIAYANDMFMKLWRVPDDLVQYPNDFALMSHVLGQVTDAMGFIKVVERLYATMETSEDEIGFKDGRLLWRRSYPVLEDDGKVARVWVFVDISQTRQYVLETTPGSELSEADEAWPGRKKRHLFGG